MLFPNAGSDDYEVIKEGEENILKVNCETKDYPPSLEDSPKAMQDIMDKLAESTAITKVVLSQKRDYEYNYLQTQMLVEIAKIYNDLAKSKNAYSYQALNFDPACSSRAMAWYTQLQTIIQNLLRSDPLGAYVEFSRIIREELIESDKVADPKLKECIRKFVALIRSLQNSLDRCKLITLAKPYLPGYKIGERVVYRKLFTPTIKPDFMFTKLMAMYPPEGEELDNYTLEDDTEVTNRFDSSMDGASLDPGETCGGGGGLET